MWLLQWIPSWLFYLTILAGIVGIAATYLIKYIPFPAVYMYKTPIQLVSIALMVFGTFMAGAKFDNDAWVAKVKELEEKVAQAEQESKVENVKIQTKVVEKTKVIKEKGDEVVKYIDREVVKYDERCEIPKELIKALNDAAAVKR